MMMNQCRPQLSPCIVLVLSLAAAFAPHLLLAQAQAPPPPSPPIRHLQFDLRSKTFDAIYIEISRLLIRSSTPAYNPTNVMQSYVLGPQRLDFFDVPPAWIYIHVVFGDGPHDKLTLAIAIDNLYLLGFSNGTDVWYKFSGGKSKSFKGLPGARVLPIRYNYGQMIEGGHEHLNEVPLGKKSATHAAKQLATYTFKRSPKSQLQVGLVRFVVMMCEAMRFRDIRQTFSGNNWEKETTITETQAKRVVDWGSLSKLIIRWELTRKLPPPRGKGAKWGQGSYTALAKKVEENSEVTNAAQALNIVDFLVRPNEIIPTD